MELQMRLLKYASSQARLHSRSDAGSMKSPTLCGQGCYSAAQLLKSWVPHNFQKSCRSTHYLHHSLKHTTRPNPIFSNEDDIRDQKFLVKSTSGEELPPFSPKGIWESAKNSADVFYRFNRPYTVLGTIIGIASMSFLAIENQSDISPRFIMGVLKAMVVALCMNTYITGVNQLSDIEIDKVNKPYLPLASGELSYSNGVMIVASSAIMSFWLALSTGSKPLICGLIVSFLCATAYSVNLPFLRWKTSSFLTAICIVTHRAFIIQVVYYAHVQSHVLQRPVIFSRTLIFATVFVGFFALVIGLVKDIPDIEGDQKFGIQSLSTRLGPKRVFWICVSILEMAYVVGICIGTLSPSPWSKLATVLGHSFLAMLLWKGAKSIDLKSKDATQGFYMFVWKLLCAEYLLLPLMR